MNEELMLRKHRLEDRLARHGILGYPISHLPYLEFNEQEFATPYSAGCRMLILYGVAYAASEPDDREGIKQWLLREGLWAHVSPNEREFLDGKVVDPQRLIDLSWEGECAYILAWALDLIEDTPSPTEQVSEEELDAFAAAVPELGTRTQDFLENLSYRNTTEIFDENLFHELATTYFRDRMFSGEENTSTIDLDVAFLRHQALNWLRRFMGVEEWDEIEVSA